MKFEHRKRNWGLPVAAAALCTSAALLLTACDEVSGPRGAGADDAGSATGDWTRTNTTDLLSTNRPAETNRDALRDTGEAIERGAGRAADKVGEGLDRAGEEIQRQAD